MDATELRALQAPIKQRYRDDPATARVAARAEARLDPGAIACTVPGWGGETRAGLLSRISTRSLRMWERLRAIREMPMSRMSSRRSSLRRSSGAIEPATS